ncbi:MAG: hypothetical protein DPW09_38140 [Anaerolineae bacterium]|nr:hypothetical protein [Anaerolineae bacterium]
MVHARRVNGETFIFGNQGGLFMNAMTWWDHQTGSVWSQGWGQAIAGPLKGTTLELIPAAIVPWSAWKADHPDTLAMLTGKDGFFNPREQPYDTWVIGITLGEDSKAYYYTALTREGVVNDFVGPYPVALYADAQTRRVQAYLRQVGDRIVTLTVDDNGKYLVDAETGAAWDVVRGLAREDSTQGESLLLVPYISSFDWAWLDFHPNSEFYR